MSENISPKTLSQGNSLEDLSINEGIPAVGHQAITDVQRPNLNDSSAFSPKKDNTTGDGKIVVHDDSAVNSSVVDDQSAGDDQPGVGGQSVVGADSSIDTESRVNQTIAYLEATAEQMAATSGDASGQISYNDEGTVVRNAYDSDGDVFQDSDTDSVDIYGISDNDWSAQETDVATIDELVPVDENGGFETTLVHQNPNAVEDGEVVVANYMLSLVRVGSPYPPAFPLSKEFIGFELSCKLMPHMGNIEGLIRKDMGGAPFKTNIVMCVTDPVILHGTRRPTLLVHAAVNSNMVPGDRWGANTAYRGSRWLYLVDKLRRYLVTHEIENVTVEFREEGLEDNEITPYYQIGDVLDIEPFAHFNAGQGIPFIIMNHLTHQHENVAPHIENMQVSWVTWPHTRVHGDYPALVFEFDLNFDADRSWGPLEQTAYNILDSMGSFWSDLHVLFRWQGEIRRGW